MRTNGTAALTFTAALLLAGCGGGGGTSATVPSGGGGGGGLSTQSQSENAIAGANAFGSPVKNINNLNQGIPLASIGRQTQSSSGTCNNGYEFFAPDKAGDPNSTEGIWFYDSACTQIARDNVRKFAISGSTETVNRTENQYAQGSSTASATKTDTITISNATFDSNGFPVVASGFDRSSNNSLVIAGSKTISSGDEIVMLPGSGGVNQFCSDSAGYNATGVASLNETFGWQGGVLTGGTRTVNGDGSVTWSETHAGTAYKGAIGALSVSTGTANTACPITTPMFTLLGGTQIGTFSIPVVATYKLGLPTNLTVTNATLANGNTLNVTTNTSVSQSNPQFINGVISGGSGTIATFATDAFGDGILTLSGSGTQYTITDWHVVK